MKTTIFLLVTLVYTSIQAQNQSVFAGISFNQNTKDVMSILKEQASNVQLIKSNAPSFPLAEEKEDHILAKNVKLNNDVIEIVIFTFGDDKLQFIEAKGNVEPMEFELDSAVNYLGYSIYQSNLLFIKENQDHAWQISPDCLHPNLFAWQNPLLDNPSGNITYNTSALIPDFLKMGGSFDSMKGALERNANFITTEELDGSDPNAQIQINAFGVEYAGFPRKFEARFGDGKLNMVWILTAKEEEDRIRQLLTSAYGNPVYTDENWEVFNDWKVSLRKDKPEVLLINDHLIPMIKDYIGQE
jgi:hypothetical protein